MEFMEIVWQTDLYDKELDLRDRLLRAPLGLTFDSEDLQAEQQQLHFGLLLGERLIACVVAVHVDDTTVKLRQMAVEQEFQRQGVGTTLIRKTEAALSVRGYGTVELNARDIAVSFYERIGYQTVGEPFNEVSIPHYKMVKQLTPS